MSQMYISPNEAQYSLRNSFCNQAALPSVDVGTDSCIIEFLIHRYIEDVAFSKKLTSNDPSYVTFGDNAFANYWEFYNVYNAGNVDLTFRGVGSGVFSTATRIDTIFQNIIHVIGVVRELDFAVFANGHLLRTGAKAAHNITTARIRFFADQTTGGIATPGKGALVRVYAMTAGNTPNDASVLATHRKYLRHPYVTPADWSAWEILRWRGRAADGSQELAGSANLHDEIQGSALALNAGNWGAARCITWQPR